MKHFIQQAEISKYTSLIEMLNSISGAETEEELINILAKSTKWVIDFQSFAIVTQDLGKNSLYVDVLMGQNEEDMSRSSIINYLLNNSDERIDLHKNNIDNIIINSKHDKLFEKCSSIFSSKLPINDKLITTLIFGTYNKVGFTKNEMLQLNIICNIAQSNLIRIFNKIKLETQYKDLENSLKKVRTMQKTIILQEKLASLGAVTAGIAHELKNPLHIILNYTKMLQHQIEEIVHENKNLPTTLLEHLNHIKSSSNTILKHSNNADKIVTAMMYKKSEGESALEDVNISNLLHNSLQISYHAMRAKNPVNVIINENIEDGVEAQVNQDDLNLTFINIFDNAFYTLYQKNEQANHNFEAKINIELFSEDNNIKIIISDNGLGIDKSIIDTVFNPFFTTKDPGEGTGLGLSFVYDVITYHKGTIDIKSGDNTKISITLPKKIAMAA